MHLAVINIYIHSLIHKYFTKNNHLLSFYSIVINHVRKSNNIIVKIIYLNTIHRPQSNYTVKVQNNTI